MKMMHISIFIEQTWWLSLTYVCILERLNIFGNVTVMLFFIENITNLQMAT